MSRLGQCLRTKGGAGVILGHDVARLGAFCKNGGLPRLKKNRGESEISRFLVFFGS